MTGPPTAPARRTGVFVAPSAESLRSESLRVVARAGPRAPLSPLSPRHLQPVHDHQVSEPVDASCVAVSMALRPSTAFEKLSKVFELGIAQTLECLLSNLFQQASSLGVSA